jgi:hypothetical protein
MPTPSTTKYLKGLFERLDMRAEWREGQNNILLVSPHGHKLDDTHTDIVTKVIANELKCSYVLNFGWKRNQEVNPALGLANCNDVEHCKQPEVQEFLNPVVDIADSLVKRFGTVQVYFIHGMGDSIREKFAGVDAVIGYGEGKEQRYTCDIWRKNLLIDMMTDCGWLCYEGAPGGKFSAYNKTNLTQAVSNSPFKGTRKRHGIQIEIVGSRRKSEYLAELTGQSLAKAILMAQQYVQTHSMDNYKRKHKVGQI